MGDSRIDRCIITFTGTSTIISNSPSETQSDTYLKIEILPTQNGKNINSIEVWYMNPNNIVSRLHEEIANVGIFNALIYSINGEGETMVDKIISYLLSLPLEDQLVIRNEYKKYIADGTILDGLVAGISSYIVFILLNESNAFINQMPFQFACPWNLNSGHTINRNMFQYLSLPLTSLSKINIPSNNILCQLVIFVQSFINMWTPLFIQGPSIGLAIETRMCTEIMSGLAQYNISILEQTQAQNDLLLKNMKSIESRLQTHIDRSISTIKREIHNLVLDAKATIKPLASESINDEIEALITSNNEFCSKLIALEHRIEVLYRMNENKLD